MIGMGLPPTPAYIVFSVLSVPALLELGVGMLGAHLFVFYFASFAPITPPVSLAAYTAAGIAGSKPMKTGMTAFLFSLPAFMIPFLFIYEPGLLLEGDLKSIVITFITSGLGIIAFAAVTVGWFVRDLNLWHRGLIAIGAFTLIVPSGMTDVIGLAIIGAVLAQVIIFREKNESAESVNGCA